MKSRETKQKDLAALTQSLQNSKSAMVVSFNKLTVTKDQEFRHSLREAGAKYQVVKNTLARIAVKGTQFEESSEYFKGVTAIAWTDNDPVVLTKTISKFLKDNSDVYNFKTGVLDGQVIDFTQLQSIANLPSKEELISKLLFVLSSPAQRLVTVINAVPRDLAVVIKQIGDQKEVPATPKAEPVPEPVAEVKAEEAAPAIAEETASPAEEVGEAPAIEDQADAEAARVEGTVTKQTPEASVEAAPAEASVETVGAAAEEPAEAVAEPADEAPTAEVEAASGETVEAADDSTEEILEIAPEVEAGEKAE